MGKPRLDYRDLPPAVEQAGLGDIALPVELDTVAALLFGPVQQFVAERQSAQDSLSPRNAFCSRKATG